MANSIAVNLFYHNQFRKETLSGLREELLHPRFWHSNFALHLVGIRDVLQDHALGIEE